MLQTVLKVKECAHCKREFMPQRPMQNVCGRLCAGRYVKAQATAKAQQTRQETRDRKERLKSIATLIKEAQTPFNAFIRARDKDKGCFVCGRPFIPGTPGRNMHAGHVRTRGAAGHLRFVEDNCLGECEGCNDPKWGAKPHQIKAGAIARIGAARFEELENDNTPHKWTREELRGIRDTYKARLKAMKEQE